MTAVAPAEATTRRPVWTWSAAVVLALVGAAVVLVRPLAPDPGAPSAAAVAMSSFPPDVLARVDAWSGPIRVAYLIRLTLSLTVPAVLLGTGAGRRLVARVAGRRLRVVRGAAVVVVLTAVATAPLTWWIGWWHSGRFGFRTSGPVRYVLETAGAIALDVLMTAVTVGLLLWIVRRRPRDWPAVATLVGTVLTALLVLVQPLVVTRLLLDPVPLDDPAVEAAVTDVLARSSVPDAALMVGSASVRTTQVNAFVTGIGPTRQVVLWDTLLALPPERVAAVVAHELAHAEHDDLPRGVVGSAAGLLPVLLLLGWARRRTAVRLGALDDGRAGVLLVAVLVVLEVAATPVVTWTSRRVEAAADHRALELTADPASLVEVTRGFVVDDLADPDPPGWVVQLGGTHPTPAQRIRAAVAFAEQAGLDPGTP